MNNKNKKEHFFSQLDKERLLNVILRQLNITALVLSDDNQFYPLHYPPKWFQSLYLKKTTQAFTLHQSINIGEHFPFIENFLYDAEIVWNKKNNGHVRSGLWTETISEIEELYLEAVAICVDNTAILLIVNETTNFDLRHKVFQNARNLALKNEKLEYSILSHQRELHKDLEVFYQQNTPEKEIIDNIEKESCAVMVCKEDGSVEIYNKALIDIYSFSQEADIEKKSLLNKWTQEAERQYPEIGRVLSSGNYWEGEFETSDNDNQKKWVRLIIAPILDEHQNLSRYICVANDISELRFSTEELERISQIDATTRLPNRRNFWRYLSDTIQKAKASNEQVALLYIDLDHFKQVNDDLGPRQADFLLTTVANRLKRCLKQKDYVANLGGDEFVVVINNFSNNKSLTKIAQRLNDNIYRDVSFNDFILNVSASIGIAIYPQHGLSSRQLVKNADYAMYHAKEMGRNQFQFAGPDSKGKIIQKLHIEQGLKSALVNNEFELLYQPQICIGEISEHRIEALIRWHHPKQGLMTPADFISIAEESGLIIEIGQWVLSTACEQIERLNTQGINAKVSINVSPKQFKYSNLTNDVKLALNSYSIPPEQLELEVTESLFLEDMNNVILQLKQLQKLGVSISLDDFGTGYSSLSYLKKLPVDILKIDRSFIHELPHNQQSSTIVKSIISMAHQLSIRVIAEGIENHNQLEYLRKHQCDFVQGFLFHAPLNSKDLIALYQSFSIP
ncbi:EAL domain-containing protein [Aliikangiella sp. IMCC44359]|uniref:EAL domain-containing protein n=1 Tax=Aliikangiella sp. IMCC44359 TaxID=3459125 RepID=UPI00403AEED8